MGLNGRLGNEKNEVWLLDSFFVLRFYFPFVCPTERDNVFGWEIKSTYWVTGGANRLIVDTIK